MHTTLTFPDRLRLINERSTAFHAAVAAAPSLDLHVPTHPGRTLFDLVQRVGMGLGTADVSARGTASDLVLLNSRMPLDSLTWDGDGRIFDQLIAWDPSR